MNAYRTVALRSVHERCLRLYRLSMAAGAASLLAFLAAVGMEWFTVAHVLLLATVAFSGSATTANTIASRFAP